MNLRITSWIFFGFLLTVGFFFFPSLTSAATEVGGVLLADETWTVAGSPYVVKQGSFSGGCVIGSGLLLAADVTLTIDPGVVVKFEEGTSLADCAGRLLANGTAESPIIFTASTDDSAGGDANNDGSETLPQPAFWYGLTLRGEGTTVQNAKIRYGQDCLRYDSNQIQARFNEINHCSVGIYAPFDLSDAVIEDHILQHNNYGMYLRSPARVTIRHNVITDNVDADGRGNGIVLQSTGNNLDINHNDVRRNGYGISAERQRGTVIHDNNLGENNEGGLLHHFYWETENIQAQNNWWGDASGPFHPTLNPDGQGSLVTLGVDFAPWLGEEVVIDESERNPVIIVPGIPGTELLENDDLIWLDILNALVSPSDDFLDVLIMDEAGMTINNDIRPGEVFRNPAGIYDYTQSLIEELETVGYLENSDLFLFPYDWRTDIDTLGQNLHDFLETNLVSEQKVDIIAHSMGGLVTEKYIQNFGKVRLDKVIFVGTPHLGSPKSAKTLIFGDPMIKFIPVVNYLEIKKIARNMPSVNTLVPNQEYFNQAGGYLRTSGELLNYTETKDFLSSLGLNGGLIQQAEDFYSTGINNLDLSGLQAYNINGCTEATLGSFGVDPSFVRLPISPKFVAGDGTVPLSSSSFVSISFPNTYFVRKISHDTMMTEEPIRKLIVGILSGAGYSDSKIIQDPSQCKIKGKLLGIFSPVDVKITDQDGNYSGPNEFASFTNDIPGVAYEVFGEEKFVFLPTDEEQSYDIELDATGTGTFDLKIQDIDEEVLSTAYYHEIRITPESTANLDISASSNDASIDFDFEGDGGFVDLPADSVLNSEQSADETAPQTDINIFGLVGQNGWYRSEIELSFDAIDDNSGILKTEYSLDDGQTWQIYNASIVISEEATTTIQFFSTDRAGNREEVQTTVFRIDLTPPEALLQFNPITKDLDISGTDNLSSVTVQVSGNTTNLSDEAGNITTLILEKSKSLKLLTAKIKELRYNENIAPLRTNVLAFIWLLDKIGQIKELSQSALVQDDFALTLYYSSKTGQTIIKGLDNGGIISETKLGMIILKIKTNFGKLDYEY